MRVAVLGSNSFAGNDFVDLLLETERFEVLGISRSQENSPAFLSYVRHGRDHFTFQQLDLNAEVDKIVRVLEAFGPQYIVNFAAQGDDTASWQHPEDFVQTNCVALAGLIDGLTQNMPFHRFLQVSSSSVYGNPSGNITEESCLRPGSPYGVSKAAADLLLLAYGKHNGFPVQIVRPPNLYGPHQQLFRIIPKTVISLKGGLLLELHGGGNAVRSYLHVRDASQAMLSILEQGRIGEVYNISADDVCRIRDIVTMICEILGKDFGESTRVVDERQGQSSVSGFNSDKIRNELGWRPKVSLRDGLQGVCDWMEREWSQLMEHSAAYVHVQ